MLVSLLSRDPIVAGRWAEALTIRTRDTTDLANVLSRRTAIHFVRLGGAEIGPVGALALVRLRLGKAVLGDSHGGRPVRPLDVGIQVRNAGAPDASVILTRFCREERASSQGYLP